MEDRKPLGIVLVVVFNSFLGSLLVPIGYVTARATGVRGAPGFSWFYGFLSLALGALLLLSAYGLWTRQPWGRQAAIRVAQLLLPLSLFGVLGVLWGAKISAGSAVASIIGLGLTVSCLRYLRQLEWPGEGMAEATLQALPEAPSAPSGAVMMDPQPSGRRSDAVAV